MTACLVAYMQHTDEHQGLALWGVPRSDALDPGHFAGVSFVGGAFDLAGERTGSGQDPLELQGGDHIGPASEAQFGAYLSIVAIRAGAQDDGPHLQLVIFGPYRRN